MKKTPSSTDLRLSAVTAFIGRIYPQTRLVKIKAVDDRVMVTVIVDAEPGEEAREEIGIAGTEIIADFPEVNLIEDKIEISTGPLPREHIVHEGWIFARAE